MSYLYLLRSKDEFKIGISKDPSKRIKQLQTGNQTHITLVECWEIPVIKIFKVETLCHESSNSTFIKRGEWFHGASEFHLKVLIEEAIQDMRLPVLPCSSKFI